MALAQFGYHLLVGKFTPSQFVLKQCLITTIAENGYRRLLGKVTVV